MESSLPVKISLLSLCRDSKFKKSDAFIGFQKDTPALVIIQATNQLRSACAAFKEGKCTKRKWDRILVWSKLSPQYWDIENVDNNAWKNAVSYYQCIYS